MKRRAAADWAGRARPAVRKRTKLLKFLKNESQFKSFVLLFKAVVQASDLSVSLGSNLKGWFDLTV